MRTENVLDKLIRLAELDGDGGDVPPAAETTIETTPAATVEITDARVLAGVIRTFLSSPDVAVIEKVALKTFMVAFASHFPRVDEESVGEAPAAPSAPDAIPEGRGPLRVVSIDSSITERNDIWWRYAWRLTLRNVGDAPEIAEADVDFLDAGGFVVDTHYGDRHLVAAGETLELAGSRLIRLPGAASVVTAKVRFAPKPVAPAPSQPAAVDVAPANEAIPPAPEGDEAAILEELTTQATRPTSHEPPGAAPTTPDAPAIVPEPAALSEPQKGQEG